MTNTDSFSIPATMQAMVTMGHGDMSQMVFQESWPCQPRRLAKY